MVRKFMLVLSVVLLSTGCVSYGLFQSAETVEPGATEAGLGTVLYVDLESGEDGRSVAPIETSLLLRHGVVKNLDIGARAWAFPGSIGEEGTGFGLYGDARYRFIEGPVMLTGSVGISGFRIGQYLSMGAYPALLAGTERFYGGARLIYLWVRDEGDGSGTTFADALETGPVYGLVAGASFGERLILRPEVSGYFSNGFSDFVLMPGLSLQYAFNGN